MTVQFLIAVVAYAINERMTRRLAYVQEEVRVLREALVNATGKKRIAFTVEQRQRLAVKGKALTPDEREGCCQLVQPATILKWFRELVAKPYDGSKQRAAGRPRKPNELRRLVLRLANENIGWGYTKIRDALRGMKIEIGRTTVAAILAEAGLEPAPERTRKRTWKHFLRSHWETLLATLQDRSVAPQGSSVTRHVDSHDGGRQVREKRSPRQRALVAEDRWGSSGPRPGVVGRH